MATQEIQIKTDEALEELKVIIKKLKKLGCMDHQITWFTKETLRKSE